MALYVITVPDPPRGQDWSYTVPGEYVEDIVSVSATLTTEVGPSVGNAEDASGHGNTGAYHPNNATLIGAPGLFAGDSAVEFFPQVFPVNNRVEAPGSAFDPSGAFTVTWWQGPDDVIAFGADMTFGPAFQVNTATNEWGYRLSIGLLNNGTYVDPGPPNAPRMIAWRQTGTDLYLYVNGVEVLHVGPYIYPATVAPITYDLADAPGLFGLNDSLGTLDEWAAWSSDIGAAAITNLYNLSATFDSYSNAVLALAPDSYYHLDDATQSTVGRTPALVIGDGTNQVGAYVSSFPVAPVSPAFDYSWLVGLSNSAQVPAGTITTVGLPPLILPAGYTVGTSTPDIGEYDQWSNVSIWWDDMYSPTAVQTIWPYPYTGRLILFPLDN